MRVLDKIPASIRGLKKTVLPVPQIRVLRALVGTTGGMSRAALSIKIGNKTNTVVGRAVGYSDPEKRAAFENSKDGGFTESLLTRGLVAEVPLDLDGVTEVVIVLTQEGRKMAEELKDLELPALRD